jgi:hypothetical protein
MVGSSAQRVLKSPCMAAGEWETPAHHGSKKGIWVMSDLSFNNGVILCSPRYHSPVPTEVTNPLQKNPQGSHLRYYEILAS